MDDFFNDPELTKVIRAILKGKGTTHKQGEAAWAMGAWWCGRRVALVGELRAP